MKASIIITTALVLNSSLLFGEGLSLVDGQIPLWALGGLESFLILVFVGDRFLKSLSKEQNAHNSNDKRLSQKIYFD